jgi:hypothetical protein
MAAALEERCSREVICRDEAIGALKKENETLEAEKARLSEEVKEFSSVRKEIDSLRKERDDYKAGSEVLKKEKEDAEASAAVLRTSVAEAGRVRDLALQRAEKAEDIAERLRKELDAERTSAAELQTRIQKAEAEAAAIVGLYADSLAKFGGSTSAPPPGGDVGAALAWLKSHIRMLPDFVGGAVDFGALAAVSSFARLLRRGGCSHAEGVAKEEFAAAEDVGEGTPSLRKSVRNFISSFWIRFGRDEAKKMAEDRRAEVCIIWLFLFVFCFAALQCYLRWVFCRRLRRRRLRLSRPVLRVHRGRRVLRPRLKRRLVILVPKLRRDLVPRFQSCPRLLLLLRLRCEAC